MDTPTAPAASESSDSSLTANEGASAFESLFGEPGDEPEKRDPEGVADEPAKPNAQNEGDDTPEPDASADEIVTVLVDGKPVELTKAQIADAHKNGMRQADYTRKTQEVSEQRKQADADQAQARAERNNYAQGLQRNNVMLEGALQQQSQIDWTALLESDPHEYMKQQHLVQTRQAALQQGAQQLEALRMQDNADQNAAQKVHLEDQREKLFATIPEWKDETKRKAGATELRDYLMTQGLTEREVYAITDHRGIMQSYKAMQYDKMMGKATLAAKKVSTLPQRVERSAGGDSNAMDKRGAAYQRFQKSGSQNDAAALFANLF